MICYRDRTWCKFYKNCANSKNCHRALTKKIIKLAEKWWGNKRPPICLYVEKPDCFKIKEKK